MCCMPHLSPSWFDHLSFTLGGKQIMELLVVVQRRSPTQRLVSTSPNSQPGGLLLVGCPECLFAATLHNGGRSSIRNLRMRHAVVTGTHLPLVKKWAKEI